MRTLLALLLVAPAVWADDKPVAIPDADLVILLDQKHPKYQDTLAKYDGKTVRLTGRVRWSTGNPGFVPAKGDKGFGLLTPAVKVKDRPVAVKLVPAETDAGDALRLRVKDAKPPGLSLTVTGRVRVGKATDGEDRERPFFAGLSDVTEAK